MNLRPMLAAPTPETLDALSFPLLASPKLDGVRCLVVNGTAVSRALKPIPNLFVQSVLSSPEYAGFDGELIVGSATAKDCFRTTTSGVMSRDGRPEFKFFVFDRWDSDLPFNLRLPVLAQHSDYSYAHIHHSIHSVRELEDYEQEVLNAGYEGLILRDPRGKYKYGRSTLREKGMVKLKRFADSEALVVGVEELRSNQNIAETDHLGYTKRSSHQANKVPMNTLGALLCKDIIHGWEFSVGSGFNLAEREILWKARSSLIGRVVKYKFFKIGMKDRPRHPTFLGFRDPGDM